jgi:hypothetical protein
MARQACGHEAKADATRYVDAGRDLNDNRIAISLAHKFHSFEQRVQTIPMGIEAGHRDVMSELSSSEISALHDALDDEYQAWVTYDQVMADFGDVMPFVNIRDAEARHIEALLALFSAYRLPIPENTWPGKVRRFGSMREACEAGVAAEVANAALYERLLAATARPDILTVFRRLREASQQRHLPAFRRCAERGGEGGGCGHGRRHRGGRI